MHPLQVFWKLNVSPFPLLLFFYHFIVTLLNCKPPVLSVLLPEGDCLLCSLPRPHYAHARDFTLAYLELLFTIVFFFYCFFFRLIT